MPDPLHSMPGKPGIPYTFNAELWQYAGKGAWFFVSLPPTLSSEIRMLLKNEEEGWGRLRAKACIGNTEWETAIWFDTKAGTYLLPVKAFVRNKEQISAGQSVQVKLLL